MIEKLQIFAAPDDGAAFFYLSVFLFISQHHFQLNNTFPMQSNISSERWPVTLISFVTF
jgi:hypothetical protein